MSSLSKFEEWFDFGGGLTKNDPYLFDDKENSEQIARHAWGACKEVVLQILKDNPRCDDYYYDLVDKIKEL